MRGLPLWIVGVMLVIAVAVEVGVHGTLLWAPKLPLVALLAVAAVRAVPRRTGGPDLRP